MIYQRSSALFKEALKYIPGGVNSPVRAFKAVGGTPIFIKEAKGAYLIDEDDNKYIESELIAYLSARSIYNLPITFPSTTGVLRPLSGGKLYNNL